ncbi:hypothetical protein [Sporomusa sphaeroides]|uniref:Uncharacterized protein n=1 Tax=Sporomusa sphaeroides DSM 2875 TaxID=1337886 RepID=A0ABM9W691_9FIRM|nr:hypothetical protein [Sporomusa sphaeroides]OLS54422.1 hypothetical protein SPSPH_45040 [Sporomusa sphaeroides DSM 2875]CVK20665.1 hypothetical protein SSPH_03333 [Sporomusa sphaeroides DSM 2875]
MATKRDLNVKVIRAYIENEAVKENIIDCFDIAKTDFPLSPDVFSWMDHLNSLAFPPSKIELNDIDGLVATWFLNSPLCIESNEEMKDLVGKIFRILRLGSNSIYSDDQVIVEVEFEEDIDTIREVEERWSAKPDIYLEAALSFNKRLQ